MLVMRDDQYQSLRGKFLGHQQQQSAVTPSKATSNAKKIRPSQDLMAEVPDDDFEKNVEDAVAPVSMVATKKVLK